MKCMYGINEAWCLGRVGGIRVYCGGTCGRGVLKEIWARVWWCVRLPGASASTLLDNRDTHSSVIFMYDTTRHRRPDWFIWCVGPARVIDIPVAAETAS